MDAARRRKTILERLGAASGPIPAAALGAELGVSRQIVVGDVALYAAHTNADVATPGVNDALCEALGLPAGVPLKPQVPSTVDKWIFTCPPEDIDTVLDGEQAQRLRAGCGWTWGAGRARTPYGPPPTTGRLRLWRNTGRRFPCFYKQVFTYTMVCTFFSKYRI